MSTDRVRRCRAAGEHLSRSSALMGKGCGCTRQADGGGRRRRRAQFKAARRRLPRLCRWPDHVADTRRHAGLATGRRVLIRAAARGAGHLAVRIAKLRGAYVRVSSAPGRPGADEAVEDWRGGRPDVRPRGRCRAGPGRRRGERPHHGGARPGHPVGQLEYPEVPSATTMLFGPTTPSYSRSRAFATRAGSGSKWRRCTH